MRAIYSLEKKYEKSGFVALAGRLSRRAKEKANGIFLTRMAEAPLDAIKKFAGKDFFRESLATGAALGVFETLSRLADRAFYKSRFSDSFDRLFHCLKSRPIRYSSIILLSIIILNTAAAFAYAELWLPPEELGMRALAAASLIIISGAGISFNELRQKSSIIAFLDKKWAEQKEAI